MPRMERFTARFTVHSFDADAFGHLFPPALSGYLQEAAGGSAARLGFAIEDLARRGLTWVLARQRVVMSAPVVLGDTLEVETWPAGVDRLAALRDFLIRRDGEEVGRAVTTWFALDVATRRPVRAEHVLPPTFHPQPEHVLPSAPARIPDLGEPEVERPFRIRFADIDLNEHVTNASYLGWALEAVDEPTWRARRVAGFDAEFLAEVRFGSRILTRSAPEGEGSRLHQVVREEDGKVVARLRTEWVAR
jgi:acyl-CoA thioesterase FadM